MILTVVGDRNEKDVKERLVVVIVFTVKQIVCFILLIFISTM